MTIATIHITEGLCQWGPARITSDEAAARQALYEESARAALATAYPDATIRHAVRRDDGRRIVEAYVATVDEEGYPSGEEPIDVAAEIAMQDRVREILGQAWQDACEATL